SADTHGALVSAAAQMPTPDGFRNHGAFVSCVAHMKDATLATIDWTTVTPEACAAAKPGKGNDPEKQAAKDTAKAERDAAKAERAAARAAAKAARQAAKGNGPRPTPANQEAGAPGAGFFVSATDRGPSGRCRPSGPPRSRSR